MACWGVVWYRGRVLWAGRPMIAHPSGVLVASWRLSLLQVSWVWDWACMQSLPIRRTVGHACLLGKLDAKWESPGIIETSSGDGMVPIKLGISWVSAFSSGLGGSFDRGVMRRPLMLRCCCGMVPCIVVVVWQVGNWSASSMVRSSITCG